MAFNAKSLKYEKQEPAFLRRLRGEHNDVRHNVQIARPQKDRLKTGDDDDGPTMVDESGRDVSKEKYEAMVSGKDDHNDIATPNSEKLFDHETTEVENQDDLVSEADDARERQKVAEIGASRKRKQAKVVGEDVEDIDVVKIQGKALDNSTSAKACSAKKKATTGKKNKHLKLSFGEPD